MKNTLVLGASDKPDRYSYMAVERLKAHGHSVWALGSKKGNVHETPIETEIDTVPDLDTITLYLNPSRQEMYYDYILNLAPKRIIFNPGTENDALVEMARAKGIQTIEACTLVMLATGQY
ncbi:MAG: CoA-binding protein [Sediminibacterium sp.]|jgi:predicted CoA-binding protein|nr:CoA-binding protein [Hydrotalea sp.]MCU0337479.1 CoA-binding protein [Sediminibacterium sp.]